MPIPRPRRADPTPATGAPPGSARLRTRAMRTGWTLVWLALVATLWMPGVAPLLLAACIGNLAAFLVLERGRLAAFPVQVRLAFLLWVAAALWLPGLHWLLLVPLAGIPARLLFGYCLLARMVSLLPWNRAERLTRRLLVQTFLSPPTDGPFVAPRPPR